MTTQTYKPPKHLSKDAAAFFSGAVAEYEFEPHHIILLTKACEAYDRAEDARKVIAKEGMAYQDRFGSPRAHPAIAIERDSRIGMARLFRELGLDIGEAASGRPPALPANRSVMHFIGALSASCCQRRVAPRAMVNSQEAAKLLWMCWRYRERQTVHVGPLKGQKIETGKRPLWHIARFILIGLYTGTRAGAIASASPFRAPGKSFVDLDSGIFYRLAIGPRHHQTSDTRTATKPVFGPSTSVVTARHRQEHFCRI